MIKVLVSGCNGSMGNNVVNAVYGEDDMEVVAGVDIRAEEGSKVVAKDGTELAPAYNDLAKAIEETNPDVMVDFTHPSAVAHNIEVGLAHNIDVVVGTTGLKDDELARLEKLIPEGRTLFVAPNFTTGAVLMMQFAKAAAPFFPEAEVIEFHHANKKDAPSGTAVTTAHLIADARDHRESGAPGKETEIAGAEGARGALIDGVPVHSVRSMGFVATQEVIFGSMGQTLTIKHDSWDRESYMPGVLLGIRSVGNEEGLIVGLENFMK